MVAQGGRVEGRGRKEGKEGKEGGGREEGSEGGMEGGIVIRRK